MLHISSHLVKHFSNNNIIGGGNDTKFPLHSIYQTTDANKSDCLMNNFEVNVAHVGVSVDLEDMKSIDSDTSFDSDVVDGFSRTNDYDCCKGQRTTAIT
jgi:hypothetical protein